VRLFSFGSINTDRFNNNSDIDLLVEFGSIDIEEYADNYFDLIEDLEDLLQRRVDDKTRQLIFTA
jgi:predicted nucleotidyltransferase